MSARPPRIVPLVAGLLLLAALGLVRLLWPASVVAPMPCTTPTLVDGALRCDGSGNAPGARAWLAGQPLDLNTASAVDLRALPGVGPKTAAAIVDERARGGAFTSVEDLARTKGIGPKTVARLRPWLHVSTP